MKTIRIGKRGTVVIPADLRRRYGIGEGSLVVAEAQPDGILIRPAVAVP
ncbi:MAG: AbrB/MazE/SpoVT family DNA-binding domain-containing protein, partial [bacterium]